MAQRIDYSIRCDCCNRDITDEDTYCDDCSTKHCPPTKLIEKALKKVLEGKYLNEIEEICGVTMDEAKELRRLL